MSLISAVSKSFKTSRQDLWLTKIDWNQMMTYIKTKMKNLSSFTQWRHILSQAECYHLQLV